MDCGNLLPLWNPAGWGTDVGGRSDVGDGWDGEAKAVTRRSLPKSRPSARRCDNPEKRPAPDCHGPSG
jgi:hypothetical protein